MRTGYPASARSPRLPGDVIGGLNMKDLYHLLLTLLLACLFAGAVTAQPDGYGPLTNAAGTGGGGDAVTLETTTMTATVNVPFTLSGRIYSKSTGAPYVNIPVALEERAPGSTAFRQIGTTTTDRDGRYSFSVTRSTPGVYYYHVSVYNQVLEGDWAVTVIGSGTVTTLPTVPPGGATMAQAYASYEAGNTAWSSAWGASDFGQIRSYLSQARAHFSTCLATANLVNDPANAANLALMKKVSTAYVALADAALAMYDGSDTYSSGRNQMNAGSYAAAAGSFQAAAEKFGQSQTLFGQATTTLQSVSFAGTSFGDGTAYIAAIVPVLNGKAAYVGEFATYARGWQYTALAYQASAAGDQAGFRTQAGQAMGQFGILRTSATFGADATSNYNILATMLGGATPAPVTTTPVTTTPVPVTGTTITALMDQGAISVTGRGSTLELAGLKIRNLRAVPLSFTVPIGTYLDSEDDEVQDMVTTETLQVNLAASEEREVLVWAACAQMTREIPTHDDSFTIEAAPPDAELVPILKALEKAGGNRAMFQAAVSIITDDATFKDLTEFILDGNQMIDENIAGTAMMVIDYNGVDITTKAIWDDREEILEGITVASLRSWLENHE
ncbi:MAG TPA: hypothetical protein PLI31_02950 [Methanoregulaceae archaeon]|nr:hypothetical protein [Methanoregulaceae archaeon]